MKTKTDYYVLTADKLAPFWEKDAVMAETDLERWEKVRALDDELVMNKESAFPIAAYRVKCLELQGYYV